MALRRVMNYREDEILRKKSKVVEKVDQKLLALIGDMVDTMYASNGVGLAAPQVGILKRVIVIDVGEGIIKLINPELINMKGEQQGVEGCLSVPGIFGDIIRPETVKVKALDENGNNIEIEGSGLLARALCHEIDHLNGILFNDKIVQGTKKIEYND